MEGEEAVGVMTGVDFKDMKSTVIKYAIRRQGRIAVRNVKKLFSK